MSLHVYESILDKHIDYCEQYSEDDPKDKWSDIDLVFVRMIIFVAKLDACNNISEHGTAENEISWHQHLFDYYVIFWTENYASSQEKYSYDDCQKKEDSLNDFKKCVHIVAILIDKLFSYALNFVYNILHKIDIIFGKFGFVFWLSISLFKKTFQSDSYCVFSRSDSHTTFNHRNSTRVKRFCGCHYFTCQYFSCIFRSCYFSSWYHLTCQNFSRSLLCLCRECRSFWCFVCISCSGNNSNGYHEIY